jgi:IS6 family transposase
MAQVEEHLYRAVDQHGQVIDVLLSRRRDAAPARALFTVHCSASRLRWKW